MNFLQCVNVAKYKNRIKAELGDASPIVRPRPFLFISLGFEFLASCSPLSLHVTAPKAATAAALAPAPKFRKCVAANLPRLMIACRSFGKTERADTFRGERTSSGQCPVLS
jgi:hypothetical protein